ncbi:phosphoketolase [Candidatus Cyanaurora vandensis]|uniref:phosphoketolase family protein n=1 Tax=Candidatus Cyanaurora vandensis TaxID=2714958 RepID=UPI00257AEB6C|nr:phosphoketolase family protein [Candidatus Cyanaurora vandensis]
MTMATTRIVLPPALLLDISSTRRQHGVKLEALARYQRLTNYLAAAQVYLKDNFLLKEPLHPAHIKDRLLGHWGTCPGINLMYAHLNRLICQHDLDMFLVTGPGHGAPANLANLYLEGSLQDYYPALTRDAAGLGELVKLFSWPGGFPSHLYPGVPGTIHEGGELGYALATAFGAVMDNPDLIVACIVGDGEAETGPTATAWHSYKFLDPKESGAVLPLLHLNGYKISNPTIYGTMSDDELNHLFTGFGWQVRIVGNNGDLDADLYASLDWSYGEIRRIQQAARTQQPIPQPRWPLLIVRSPKGMTGIATMDGKPITGSYRSHQVPGKDLQKNPAHLAAVETWLRSYRIEELLDDQGRPNPEILDQCPQGARRMGSNPHTFGGKILRPLVLPKLTDYAVPVTPHGACQRGQSHTSSVSAVAQYLQAVIQQNDQTFRIFCPDELVSNLLGSVLDVTQRNYQWPTQPEDEGIGPDGGRVIEVLSEHTCQAFLQGYLLTGRHGLFPSYEAFLGIVTTMMDQYAKFLKMSGDFPWRLPVASLNYLETSTLWRQEHNGFSHQSPGFINAVLNKKAKVTRVYLPPDANCLISTMDHCLRSKNYVNLVIANKQPLPQWLSMPEAVAHCRAGASVWPWASTDEGVNPDVVLVGIGDNTTLEVMAAAHILRQEFPQLRVRVVNVTDLLVLEEDTEHPHGLDHTLFAALFTPDRPVIINFHGYPSVVKYLLFNRPHQERFHINGYQEEGTTTTPFDMNVRNGTSRYHLIQQAIRLASLHNPHVAVQANERISHYTYVLRDHRRYIQEHGSDPEDVTHWQWC